MRTIEDKLTIYGPSICVCGNYKETVFYGRYQLTCRRHPGHPLYFMESERLDEGLTTPAKALDSVPS